MTTFTPTATGSFSNTALGWGAGTHEHTWAKTGHPALGWVAAYAGVAVILSLVCALAFI